MPFDPTRPIAGVDVDANELRAQFNALKALIDSQAAQIATMQTQNAAQIAALAAQMAAMQTQSSTQIATLVTQNSALAARCDSLQTENDHLQSECDSLQAQITALTPHGHTASGFGDARANGTLTQIPDRFGSPAYVLSGGGMIIVIPTGGGWELWEGDPNGQMYSPLYRVNGADITGAWYTVTGAAPAGTIS